MNKTFAALAVSVALVSIGASALPAFAGDMNNGGHGSSKGRAHGAAVPAPVPYEEHYKYYIGAGIGWAFRSAGDIDLTVGGNVGTYQPSFGGDDFKGPMSVSLYAGRYITPSLRMELGIDTRTEQKRARTAYYQASLTSTAAIGPAGALMPVTNHYDVTRTDTASIRNHTFMLNAYYDMNRGGRFNPYVGAGIGISQMLFHRAATETANCVYGNDPAATGNIDCWAGMGATTMPRGSVGIASTGSQTGYGLAAALMAGFTYNLSDRTHLDVGYRLMYQGGKAAVSSSSLGYCTSCGGVGGVSLMNVDSRIDHEVRTGLRWDLW